MIPPIPGWGRTTQAEATPFKWRLLDTESQACSKPQGYPSISELTQSCEVETILPSLLPGKGGQACCQEPPSYLLPTDALFLLTALNTTRSEEMVWLPACIPGSELSLSASLPTHEASGPPDTGWEQGQCCGPDARSLVIPGEMGRRESGLGHQSP